VAWRVLFQEMVFSCVENTNSPLGVVGVPLDHTSTYRPGTRFAPMRIREASCNIELYSVASGLFLEEVGFRDYYDLVLPPGSLEQVARYIELGLGNIVKDSNRLLIILGGEHLLTYFSVKHFLKDVDTFIVFDAHLDTRNEYLGSRLNHATFLRRLLEECSDLNVIHIGSRAYSKEELEFAKSSRIKLYNVLSSLRGKVELEDIGRVYISIDMDVFDPAYAPGVSNPEPLGLDLMSFIEILKQIYARSSKVIGVDIVEVNPLVDINNITSILAAKVALEVAGLYLARNST